MAGIITDFFEGFLTVGDIIQDLRKARPNRSHGLGSWLIWVIVILSLLALLASPFVAWQYDLTTLALWVSMSGLFAMLGIVEIKRRLRNRRIEEREKARSGSRGGWN